MDHYLAIIQTILDRCENDNTSPDIHDMEIIKINLCRIIQTRYGLTQLWFIPLIERIQNACCKHQIIGLKKMEQMLGYNYQRINMNDRRKDSINY